MWSQISQFFAAHPVLSAVVRLGLITFLMAPYLLGLNKVKDHD